MTVERQVTTGSIQRLFVVTVVDVFLELVFSCYANGLRRGCSQPMEHGRIAPTSRMSWNDLRRFFPGRSGYAM